MIELRPYGDTTDDGVVQVSFTLPIAAGERARQAALTLAGKMGFTRSRVVHMKAMGEDFTFFVMYGSVAHSIDPDALSVPERDFPELSHHEVDRVIREHLRRPLVVVGACTGTDAHTVGLDAILSMKGFGGDKGLESFAEIQVVNLGSQVTPAEIVESVARERADAVLISQVVTQRDAHILHLREVHDALVGAGVRDDLVLVGGGPRFDPQQAGDLGYDRIFGPNTTPSEVASFLAWSVAGRKSA